VYAAGYEYDGQRQVAKVWKNGVAENLTDESQISAANSVIVSGNDVYAAGSVGSVAAVWKNGVAQSLTDGTNSSNAYSVFVAERE
jgi:hypothetical protein